MNALKIACFSDRGEMLGRRLKAGEVTRFPGTSTLRDWTQAGFAEGEAMLFIGSCQIAVRAIAPFVKSKLTDPAVVAMDETGTYAGRLTQKRAEVKKLCPCYQECIRICCACGADRLRGRSNFF